MYRAWDKKNKIMITGEEDYLDDTYDGVMSNPLAMINHSLTDEDFIFMESTDVYDEEDRLIFEGDIVEVKRPEGPFVAEVVKRLGSMMLKHDGVSLPLYSYISKEERKQKPVKAWRLRVISNICVERLDDESELKEDFKKSIEIIEKGLKDFDTYMSEEIEDLKDSLLDEPVYSGMLISSFEQQKQEEEDTKNLESTEEFLDGKQKLYDEVTVFTAGLRDAYMEIKKIYYFYKVRLMELTKDSYSLKYDVLNTNTRKLHYDQIMEMIYDCLEEIKQTYNQLK